MPFGMGPAGWAYMSPYAYPYVPSPYRAWPWWPYWGGGWGRGRGRGFGRSWFRRYWYPWW